MRYIWTTLLLYFALASVCFIAVSLGSTIQTDTAMLASTAILCWLIGVFLPVDSIRITIVFYILICSTTTMCTITAMRLPLLDHHLSAENHWVIMVFALACYTLYDTGAITGVHTILTAGGRRSEAGDSALVTVVVIVVVASTIDNGIIAESS